MTKRSYKGIAWLLVFVFILAAVPMQSLWALAEDAIRPYSVTASGTCGKNLTWQLDSEGVLTISGTGDMDNFDRMGRPWQDHTDDITAIVIKEGVTSIGDYAFSWFWDVESVSIPGSVKRIGMWAFSAAMIRSVTIPEGVERIEEGAFDSGYALTEVNLPKSLTYIGDQAFFLCGSVNTVRYSGSKADWNKVYVGRRNGGLAPWDGDFYTADDILGNVVYPATNGAIFFDLRTKSISDCESTVTEAVIPAEIDGAAVLHIGESAFEGCTELTRVVLPNSVENIAMNAFRNCYNLFSVQFSENLTEIGQEAFYSCWGLSNVELPESLVELGTGAFARCASLTQVTLPAAVETIYKYEPLPIGGWLWEETAFVGCSNLERVDVAADNKVYTSVDGVVYSKDMRILFHYPEGKKGSEYEIPAGVKEICEGAFYNGTRLEKVTIPNTVKEIGPAAFMNCVSLKSLTIPSGVKYLRDSLCEGCESLESITIPRSVIAVYYDVVDGCNNLKTVYYGGTKELREQMEIDSWNDPLLNAEWIYLDLEEVVSGDADGDGVITDWDVMLVARSLAGWSVSADETAADVDGDGKVTDIDALLLARYLAGWDIVLG